MFKFVFVFAICVAYATAGLVQPTLFAAAPPAVAYANAPLYAAGGSQQVDVRHNYDGTLSSYTTHPFGLAAPYSSRYVAGAPNAFAAPAGLTAPLAANPFAAYAASVKYAGPLATTSPYYSPYAAHLSAAAYNAYANAYAASPVSAPVV